MIETKAAVKTQAPDCGPAWPHPDISAPTAEAIIPVAEGFGTAGEDYENIQATDSSEFRKPVTHILIVKLDHFGDFIIGLPAMAALRSAFPTAIIRLICGRWNERNAIDSGLVDEVFGFNFFPERPYSQDNDVDSLDVFDRAVVGCFDIAIDLRADHDTRHLLARVDARLRCGIGCAGRFPLLDIALPEEHPVRANQQSDQFRYFPPSAFYTTLADKGPLHHFGALASGALFDGLGASLPIGRLVAEVSLTVRAHIPGPRPSAIAFQVVQDGVVRETRTYGRTGILRLRKRVVFFTFENWDERAIYDFRAYVTGRPLRGSVLFSGVTVHPEEVVPVARYKPVELHVGEKLSLLVNLIRERTCDLYGNILRSASPADLTTSGRVRIAVAPFSNSTIRDWPLEYYSRLVSMLLKNLPCEITLLGTPEQMKAARTITAGLNSPHLIDLVGRTSWTDLQDIIRQSDLVICNNSGIAHKAAAVGARLLAIYSASHPPKEWGPRGMHVRTLMHKMPCSPCGFERLSECPAEHSCMRLISPEYVMSEVRAVLGLPKDDGTFDTPNTLGSRTNTRQTPMRDLVAADDR